MGPRNGEVGVAHREALTGMAAVQTYYGEFVPTVGCARGQRLLHLAAIGFGKNEFVIRAIFAEEWLEVPDFDDVTGHDIRVAQQNAADFDAVRGNRFVRAPNFTPDALHHVQ